jgi:alpha-mannosidase
VKPGSAWGKQFDQRWFKIEGSARFPKAAYLEWRDQGEATLYVNGVPYYGFDVAHRRVQLPRGAAELWIEGYCCQTAIWHPEATGLSSDGSVFGGAFSVERDELSWAALHDLQCLADLMMQLRARQSPTPASELSRFGQQPSVESVTPAYRVLLSRLSSALDAYDTSGAAALRTKLAAVFREFREPRSLLRASLTGHAHIDLVWLWPERMGEAKAVHTFATADRMMSLYPEFRFAYSQPASYRAVEQRSPALAARVSKRIQSGQWQATGAMEVESDTLLPCGEALARSFLLGQAEFKRLRGSPSPLLWLPDVFGYSNCLPQLMRLAGVKWFFTTKLTWSAINRFPYSSFIWKGADGSEVVAHVTQNAGYNNRLDLGEIYANACGHVQADIHPDFLHPTGYGDGGGGITEEMCERARRLTALAGNPLLAWDHPEAFFERLDQRRDALPVYQGECYLEYHRGTYTTHGDLKQAFRELECALQVREAAAVVCASVPDLTHAWRRMIFAQFHDYIPGSSISDVYAEGVPELQRLAVQQIAEASAELDGGSEDRTWRAFNVLPQPWRGWVRLPSSARRVWLQLDPLSSASVTSPEAAVPSPVSLRNRTLSNGRVHAEVDASGWLHTLRIDDRTIALNGPAAQLVLYADRPSNYDAWDIDRHSLALGIPVSPATSIRVEVNRRDRVVLAASFRIGTASTLVLRYILNAGEAVLRIDAEVDWHEQHALLKLHFPTMYRGAHARFGAPFGSVLRPQQQGASAAEAQWEVAGSRWAAVADDGERAGLALMTKAKYGFSARDGELTVSLLRSSRITGCGDARYSVAAELNRHQPDSPFSDQGRHLIQLAVGAYSLSAPVAEQPAALAESLFTDPVLYRGAPRSSGLVNVAGLATLVPAWAKPLTADAWLLRLHEVGGQRGEATLVLEPGWRAERCALDGAVSVRASRLERFAVKPYEIVSLRISRVAQRTVLRRTSRPISKPRKGE